MLCDPVKNVDNRPAVLEAPIEQGALSLHHVAMGSDMSGIFELLKKEARQNWQVDGLLDYFKDSFSYMAGSSSSQAFIMRLDQLILFEIEVHEARKHAGLRDDFVPGKGDFFVQVFTGEAEEAAPAVYSLAIRRCLDYFWKFPEVKGIVIPVFTGEHEALQSSLMEGAGLKLLLPPLTQFPALYID